MIVDAHVEILGAALALIATIPPETDEDRERANAGDDPRVDGPVLAASDAASEVFDRMVLDDGLEAQAARDRIVAAYLTRDPDAVADAVLAALATSRAIVAFDPLAIDPQARVDLTTEITDDMRASIERAIARRNLEAS